MQCKFRAWILNMVGASGCATTSDYSRIDMWTLNKLRMATQIYVRNTDNVKIESSIFLRVLSFTIWVSIKMEIHPRRIAKSPFSSVVTRVTVEKKISLFSMILICIDETLRKCFFCTSAVTIFCGRFYMLFSKQWFANLNSSSRGKVARN